MLPPQLRGQAQGRVEGWVLPGLCWQLLASCLVRCSCGGGGGGLASSSRCQSQVRVERTEQDEGCPDRISCKYGSDTRSGPEGGLGVLEGSGDIVYKSVQVPIAKRAVTGCSRFFRTRGTATGCAGRGLHLVSWCCQCAVVSRLEAPNSHSAWCWSGWTWARPWRWQGHPW